MTTETKQQEAWSGGMFPKGQSVWKEINRSMSRPMDGENWCIGDVYDNRRMRGYCLKINRSQFRETFLKKNFTHDHITFILAHERYDFKDIESVDHGKPTIVAQAIADKVHGRKYRGYATNHITKEVWDSIEVPQWLTDEN